MPPVLPSRLLRQGLLGLLPMMALPALAAEPHWLSPIQVTASDDQPLPDTPVRTDVVTQAEISRTHARNLKEALENVPGLQLREIHGKSGYEVSLQGFTSDQVLVLIDGLPISASTGSTVDLSQYSLLDVERIEVIKGASSAQYGSAAMGGVINVITRQPQAGFAGQVVLDAGSYGSQNISGRTLDANNQHGQINVQGGSGPWRLRLGADRQDNDGFRVDPDSWARQGDTVQRDQYSGYLAWQPDDQRRLWLDVSRYEEDAEQRYTQFAPPNYVPQRKLEAIERDRVAGGGEWFLDSGLGLQLKALHETYDGRSLAYSQSALATDRDVSMTTERVNTQMDLPLWRNQLWQIGLDHHRETLEQFANGVSELNTDRVERDGTELFLHNHILFTERLEVLLGLRYQHDSDFGNYTVPKASLRLDYLDSPAWQGTLRASVGAGYRVPNLKERFFRFDHSHLGYMVIGNPNLDPESSTSWQLGTRLQSGAGMVIDINAFYNRIADLIQEDLDNAVNVNGVDIYTYANVARAQTYGLESSVIIPLTRLVSLSASYTYTDTEDRDTGQALTRRPKHIARAGIDWTLPSETTSVSLRARYQSRELTATGSDAYSPAWTTADLRLNQDITPQLRIFAGIDNLFDKQRDFADQSDFGPIHGRFGYLGVRYQWGAHTR